MLPFGSEPVARCGAAFLLASGPWKCNRIPPGFRRSMQSLLDRQETVSSLLYNSYDLSLNLILTEKPPKWLLPNKLDRAAFLV